MRTAIGVILWSFILVMLYRNAPRITPHAAKLFRFGIGCVSLGCLWGYGSAFGQSH
jgi:hypothetical protein